MEDLLKLKLSFHNPKLVFVRQGITLAKHNKGHLTDKKMLTSILLRLVNM